LKPIVTGSIESPMHASDAADGLRLAA